jgi:CRISPR-associated protein Cas6/Cse3/CasE subtype I-E
MSGLFLSRITLRTDPSVATLAPILFDAAGRHRSEASRRLVWTLFADSENRKRDFLWREDASGRFYLLSSRQPQDQHHLFTVETKAFEPALSSGDKLVFSLRANATIARPRSERVNATMSSWPPSKMFRRMCVQIGGRTSSSRKVSRGFGARGRRQVLISTKVASRSMDMNH